jgi:predicted GNAT family N-acyltransferase
MIPSVREASSFPNLCIIEIPLDISYLFIQSKDCILVIKMNVNIYDTLPDEAAEIRRNVFVEEQGFHNEFDEIDKHAKHIVLYHNNFPVATCRFFEDETAGNHCIGRIAVIKQYRGKNLGSLLLKCAETEIEKNGGKCAFLHAQTGAIKFYEKNGYVKYGEMDFDESCPHFWMRKILRERKRRI